MSIIGDKEMEPKAVIVYRNGTFGHYIECLTWDAYKWWVGPYAWDGCYNNECCLFIW